MPYTSQTSKRFTRTLEDLAKSEFVIGKIFENCRKPTEGTSRSIRRI